MSYRNENDMDSRDVGAFLGKLEVRYFPPTPSVNDPMAQRGYLAARNIGFLATITEGSDPVSEIDAELGRMIGQLRNQLIAALPPQSRRK